MKQQILLIHGGDTFNSNEEYLEFLQDFPIDLERMRPGVSWKQDLEKNLGEQFTVFQPKMPNASNAKYSEWKLWFEKVLALLNENIILIGHSLGGIFLAKYLAQNPSPKKIQALILIAAPAKDDLEPIASFALPPSLEAVTKQAKNIYIFHSADDEVVPVSHLAEYEKLLPTAQVKIFANHGHFNQEEFPELVELIQSLS